MELDFGVYDDLEISEIDFSEGEFSINYLGKMDDLMAESVLRDGELIGKFDDTGTSCWNVVKMNNSFYVSLDVFNDVWEVNETILDRI